MSRPASAPEAGAPEAGETAPLLRLPGQPAPEVGGAEWFEAADGRRLRAALFPAKAPIGAVVISTGRTEFIEKYLEVADELVRRGYSVLVHDWRGQGLSSRLLPDRLKGHADGFEAMTGDFKTLLDRFEDRLPRPWISLAHSMGGCLTGLALAEGEARFAGAIFCAPMWGIAGHSRVLASVGSRIACALGLGQAHALKPYDPFASRFEGDRLTHDPVRYQRTIDQIGAVRELALGAVTWGWIRSAYAGIDRLVSLLAIAPRIRMPVTVLSAGEDAIVDSDAARAVAARIPAAKWRLVPGAYHEILMETDPVRAIFWQEFDALAAEVLTAAVGEQV